MEHRPFEILAECEISGFPTGKDIERVSARIERARRQQPNVVQAAVSTPAIFRETRYVLQTRFVVWAEGSANAMRAVENLLKDAGVRCGTVFPSGRTLTEAAVPRPARVVKSAPAAKGAAPRRPKPARRAARPGLRKKRTRTAKTAAKR